MASAISAAAAVASGGSQPHQALPPAHNAASLGDIAELRRLYSDNRYRPAKSDPTTGETPMHAAVRAQKLEALKFLLENHYIDPQARAKNGETAAHIAACEGWLEGLQALCSYDKRRRVLIVTDQDLQGLTPLHIAIISCKEQLVEWILDNFTSEQLKLTERGSLAVHFAAASGNVAILRMLVGHGGVECATMQDENSTTPVYFAAQEGQVETLKYLIVECQVDGRAKSNDGMQPIHAATQNGRAHAVKYLVGKMGRSLLQERTNDGATPIHFAAAGGHTDILKWMLNSQNGSVLAKVCDALQSTPAHDAVDYGHLECVKVLLKHNADLFAMDDDGTSPYSLAMAQQDSEIKDYVQEHVRTRRLKPPVGQLPLSSEWDDVVYHPVSPTSHPSVPATGSQQRSGSKPSPGTDGGAAAAAASASGGASAKRSTVQTLDSQGDEIRVAQQQVMAHHLSTALEAVSEQQSSEAKRPTRKRSMHVEAATADPNLRHGETAAAALAFKASRSPKASTAAPAAAASGSDWTDRPIVHKIDAVDHAVPPESDSEDNKSDTPGAMMRSEDRRDPDGQEHGSPGVDSWFADTKGRERAGTISDRPPMPLPVNGSIDDPDIDAREEDEEETPQNRHIRSTTSWYSSDGDMPTSAQYRDHKSHRKSGRHSKKHGIRSGRPMSMKLMPVFQPMMTPYGPMMTQTFMPVPAGAVKGHKRSRKTRSKAKLEVKEEEEANAKEKDHEAGSRPSLGVVSEEDELETENTESFAESTLPKSMKGGRSDGDLPARKRQRKDIASSPPGIGHRRPSMSPYGMFSFGGGPAGRSSQVPPGVMPSMPGMPGMMPPMMGPGMMPPMMPQRGMPRMMMPPMMPGVMPGPNGKGLNFYQGGMMPGMMPGMMGGTMPPMGPPRTSPMSPKSPTLPPRRVSVMDRILGKRNSSNAMSPEDAGPKSTDLIYDTPAGEFDPYELPIDYKKGSTLAELIINCSVIGLGVVAGVPRIKSSGGLQPSSADSNFLLGNSSTAGLGEPMSLEEAKRLSVEESAPYVEPFRPPSKATPGDKRIGALSKLTKKFSLRKGGQPELDDTSAKGSTAWEYSHKMERKAGENWVGGEMPEGIAALSAAADHAAAVSQPAGAKRRGKKKPETQDAFSPKGPGHVEGVGFSRKLSGPSSVLGIFSAEAHGLDVYEMNKGRNSMEESWFERKAADGEGQHPEAAGSRAVASSPPTSPPPPPGPPPPPPPAPEMENKTPEAPATPRASMKPNESLSDLYAKPSVVSRPTRQSTAASVDNSEVSHHPTSPPGAPSDGYSEPFQPTKPSSRTARQPTSPPSGPSKPTSPTSPPGSAASKPKTSLSDLYTKPNKPKATAADQKKDAPRKEPTAPYAKPIPKSQRQIARLQEGEGQDSLSTVASSAKARQHITELVKNDVRAMMTDSGDDISEVSAFRSVSQAPTTTSAPSAAAAATSPGSDPDDPFGLSELALALQLAGEAEYWKESLSAEPEAKPAPDFKSSAAVESSAAAAVVFDEALLDPSKQADAQKKANQPSHGTLASPSKSNAKTDDVMATVAALSSFGGDDDDAGTSSSQQPSVPTRMGSMPHQETKMVKGKSKSSWINATSTSKTTLAAPAPVSTKSTSIKVSSSKKPSLTMVTVDPPPPKAPSLAPPAATLAVPEVSVLPGTPGAARKMWQQMTSKKPTSDTTQTTTTSSTTSSSTTTTAASRPSGFLAPSAPKTSLPKSPSSSFAPGNAVKAPKLTQINAKQSTPPPPSETEVSDELAKVFERRRTKAAQNAFLDSYKKATVD